MNEWLDGAIVGLGVATILMGIAILVLSRRSLSEVFLAVFLILWGVTGGSGRLFSLLGVSDALVSYSFVLLRLVLFLTLICFAIVYPDIRIGRWQKRGLAIVALTTTGLAALALLTPLERYDTLVRDLVRPYMAATYVLGLTLLATRWLRSRGGDYRNQVAWGLVVFIFWCFHDGLGLVGYGLIFRHEWALGLVFASLWTIFAGLVWVLGILLAVGLIAYSVKRFVAGDTGRDIRYIALLAPYLIAITTLQVFDPGYVSQGPGSIHVAIDYLIVVFVVYGVLRFNIIEIDLKVKWALGKSTLAAVFLGVFFIVANVGQALFTEELGWASGGVAAGLLFLAINPLHRWAQGVADTTMPMVTDTAEYRLVRKREVYRTAVQGALADAHITEKERDMLAALADQLGLSAGDARTLEREALSASPTH